MIKVGNLKITWHHQKPDRTERPATNCGIWEDDNQNGMTLIGTGSAVVHPNDNFSRDKGRQVALKRAFQDAEIPKEKRKQIWEVYRTGMTAKPRW